MAEIKYDTDGESRVDALIDGAVIGWIAWGRGQEAEYLPQDRVPRVQEIFVAPRSGGRGSRPRSSRSHSSSSRTWRPHGG